MIEKNSLNILYFVEHFRGSQQHLENEILKAVDMPQIKLKVIKAYPVKTIINKVINK